MLLKANQLAKLDSEIKLLCTTFFVFLILSPVSDCNFNCINVSVNKSVLHTYLNMFVDILKTVHLQQNFSRFCRLQPLHGNRTDSNVKVLT